MKKTSPWWYVGGGAVGLLVLVKLRQRARLVARLAPAGFVDDAATTDPAGWPFWRVGAVYAARATGYCPRNDPMEGGVNDRHGFPLQTLQAFLAGQAPWVSTAMDPHAFPYGAKLRIPEMDAHYGRAIPFRVVDTGGDFYGKGTTRIDVCSACDHMLDPLVNGTLTLVVV